jgi:hypothetical protein
MISSVNILDWIIILFVFLLTVAASIYGVQKNMHQMEY